MASFCTDQFINKLPPLKFTVAGVEHSFESIGAMIAKKRAEQTDGIVRDWMREELGSECPAADEDIATVAIGLGYRFERVVPATGDTETLALFRNRKLVRSIGVRKPF